MRTTRPINRLDIAPHPSGPIYHASRPGLESGFGKLRYPFTEIPGQEYTGPSMNFS